MDDKCIQIDERFSKYYKFYYRSYNCIEILSKIMNAAKFKINLIISNNSFWFFYKILLKRVNFFKIFKNTHTLKKETFGKCVIRR